MSAEDLFTRDLWESVADGLRGSAARWWEHNREDLLELSEGEVRQMLKALEEGDTVEAKQRLAAIWIREDRESWEAFRDGITHDLRGIAARRARVIRALEELVERAARILGKAARGAIGL